MTDVLPPAPLLTRVRTALICDDRPPARNALSARLTSERLVTVVADVPDGFAVVDAYTAHPTDVVLIGVQPGGGTGLDAVSLLLGLHPAAAVIAFGPRAATDSLVMAVTRGALGVMVWDPNRLARGVPDALGQGALDDRRGGAAELTERELQVLHGMSQGRSNQEIGRRLFLSEDTVKTHARRLFSKLDARARAHAVAIGLRNGLLN